MIEYAVGYLMLGIGFGELFLFLKRRDPLRFLYIERRQWVMSYIACVLIWPVIVLASIIYFFIKEGPRR